MAIVKAQTSATALFLLWMCGCCLRLTVLAVPPVISVIQDELHLSGTAVGMLTGIPVIMFALAAAPGSTLITRFGVHRTLIAGLLIAAIASGARGIGANAVELYLATIVMSAGIAIMQPSMAAAVRQWVPHRPTFGTAVYTNGLIFGEIIPVATMLPLLLPVLGGWRMALGVWSLPLLITGILVALLRRAGSAASSVPAHPLGWIPDLNSGLNWRIGLALGSISSAYFCMNGFLPAFLNGTGRTDLVSAVLTALNLGQLPTSVMLLFTADKVQGRRWPYLVIGLLMVGCIIGIMFGGGSWPVIWAGLLGATGGGALVLCLALAPLLCRDPDNVARTSAAAFAISYGYAMLISFLSGAAWDLAGNVIAALIPILLGMLPIFFVARRLVPQPAT
jgi:MFS transporter, CP family, cyanate transporter